MTAPPTTGLAAPERAPGRGRGPRETFKHSKHTLARARHARLLFAPSLLISFFFVYLFIGTTLYISFSNWRIGTSRDLTLQSPWWSTYSKLAEEMRFQADIRNVVVFTVLFLAVAVIAGLVAALLIHHVAVGRGLFRAVFMLPYALSFIVTGVAWRWIFNPNTGVNEILRWFGIENPPGWTTDTSILLALNNPTGAGPLKIELGIPVALIPIVLAAAWQLMGFAMAIYLAGLGSIPEEHLEAAQLDGAGVWKRLRHVVLPQLKPSTITALVLLLHVALKMFDLVVAMSGSGPGFVTDVPGIYIYDYLGSRYDKASAASMVLLVMTLVFVVPYLIRSYRRGGDS
ncbi:carbohydrate ABC transporter permease [Ruania albidiflava]|uniref:carbohydrate ABC transporter permease n=1 Tax=Ruania albidiflava TaxID=366586 RepID=UPI0003B75C73|nr:sugar ABC transporter permease [Ruania albidiflava]